MENEMIYLDYNATTYIHEKVQEEMKPYLDLYFGNPSSSHKFGIQTKKAITKAREQVAKMLGCDINEIVFTSGGSESNNYANKGIVNKYFHTDITKPKDKISIMCSSIEHPSVKEIYKYLQSVYMDKLEVIYLPVNSEGIVDLEKFKELMQKNTLLISVMLANNETGSLQPIKEISEYAKTVNPNCVIHTDASQAIGKVPVNVNELKCDLLTLAGHKFYGPKGIGALYIKNGVEKRMEKIIHGASHENNLRAGTENVLEIVGLGKACELVQNELTERMKHNLINRNIIYQTLSENYPNIVLQGPKINYKEYQNKIQNLNYEELNKIVQNEKRLTNTLYISFPNIEANLIMSNLSDKVAFSAGAACHSEGVTMSYVLQEMKVKPEIAMGTLRISVGIKTTQEEAFKAANYILDVVNKLNHNNTPVADESIENCKLTKNTHGMGCGCKIPPKLLNEILSKLPEQKCIKNNPNILVDNKSFDDAAIYDLTSEIKNDKELSLVSTLDFFAPICDSAYDYGAIACANALSDIYAMGGKPVNALSIVCFPTNILPHNVLKEILKGAQDKADEANCPILGGHSIDDVEPKFGLSVCGIVNKNRVWKNNAIEKNNYILLTKRIGTGIIMAALKKEVLNNNDILVKKAIDSMKFLNKYHQEIIVNNDIKINACTDVTGFGLICHLNECLGNNKDLYADINFDNIPLIGDQLYDLVNMEIYSGKSKSNMNYVNDHVEYDSKITNQQKIIINDPQTSGGLLLFLNEDNKNKLIELFKKANLDYFELGMIKERSKEQKYSIKVNKN